MKPHLQTTIWTLLRANASQREIERVTGIYRHTIRTYQKRFAAEWANCSGAATGSEAVASQTAPPRPPAFAVAPGSAATSLCEPHREFIQAQLRLKRNAMAIYQDLVDQHGFAGQYNSVKRFCAKLRHKEPEQFDRLSFLPGEEMQVDYGEGAPTRVPGSDRYRKPRLFVATLRHSRASFRYVVWKSSHQIWAELHERAFRYFGGCPQYVVLDNLKEGVIKPDLYEPELNKVYAATLAHYAVVADPARVRDPNRKVSETDKNVAAMGFELSLDAVRSRYGEGWNKVASPMPQKRVSGAVDPVAEPANFAEPGAPERDAIDELVDAELNQWQLVMAPLVDPLQQAIDEAVAKGETAQQLLDRLPALLQTMDPRALAESLTRAALTARIGAAAGIPTSLEN